VNRAPNYLWQALRRYPHQPAYAFWRALELRHLSQLTFVEPILDLGCYDGSFAHLLFEPGRAVFGLDLSRAHLEAARHSPAYTAVTCGDATRLPFRSDAFGSLLSNCVLEHLPDDAAALGEMARVVRPGGLIAFTVPGPDFRRGLYTYQCLLARGEQHQADAYLQETDRRLAHHHYRTAAEWQQMLSQAHLVVERLEPYLVGPALAVWDRLDNLLNQAVMGVLGSKRLALFMLLPRWCQLWCVYVYLRRFYRLERLPADLYGCWMVVARRP
jgi:SAM-dependent methyltransferase